MRNIITTNNIAWVDILNPKEKDLEYLKGKFYLHPKIAHQFLPPIHRPKIEEYPIPQKAIQLFLVLHFPVFDKKTRSTEPIELDFIVTPDFLITSHTKRIPALEIFFNDCKFQKYYQNSCFKTTGHLLFNLLDFLIDSCLPMLDHIAENIENIEKQVFQGKEREMLSEIAVVKKDIIDFRRAIKPQKSVLDLLYKKAERLFRKELKPLAQEVVGSNIRVWNTLENHKELIESIEQTNNSLLSYKISDIVKILTVISFVTFPLSVIVGFFGMNVFGELPSLQWKFTWLAILIFMIISSLLMLWAFRRKKWI